MKAYLYKFMPLLILVIGLIVLYVINDYPILLHVIVIIAFITSGLKNVYFVNNNIRNHIIWMSPKLDRILGMLSGILYSGIYVVSFIKQQPLWIVILILVLTVGTAVLLETKLHITSSQLEERLSSERIKRKVISRHKAQLLKNIFFTVIVVVIISMLISLYLKLMVIFGLALAIFIFASISVAIFEKYFTIIENM
ncbi:hypothetical protein ACFDA8_02700 [Staphylococcus epidermidis]|uniref:hypothetical protein n=1 Tax=Staphylococcus epidermidis TaxID=1282 RepID=UPI000B27D8A8